MQELSLSELNLKIKSTLEDHLEASYWVVAEIGQLQMNQSGHCYLELVQKEGNQVIAKARATIWAYTYRNISAWFERITGSTLEPGMNILANVKVAFHEVYGLSLNIKDIDPSYTLGEREKSRQEVIKKLEEDGVFEINKGLILPTVPQKIAIISSETAAGYGDFINQLENNPYGYAIHYHLYPAIMQGDKAPESIINALHQIYEADEHELVVIIRGGGSQLDLDCFDDYELCSHIAQFPLPVLTGIGHERDTTIADMVAHTQLKTPTAVAEFIVQGFAAYHVKVEDLFETIRSITLSRFAREKERIIYISSTVGQHAKYRLHNQSSNLSSITQSIKHLTSKQVQLNFNLIGSIEQKIELLDPKHILNKGYSVTYKNGKPLGKEKVKKNDTIETITASQKIESNVFKTINQKNS